MFLTASEEALDMIKKLLQFNPTKRLSVEHALKHPNVAQFRNPDDEPNCTMKINSPIDDNQKFSIRECRNILYSDSHKRKKELRKKILAQHQTFYQQMGKGSSRGGNQAQSSQSQSQQQQMYQQ